ncbi:cingulin-like protein 1 isoform X1 [Salmo salar]|uniref:Cingulin-like protein 1 isoform X1 n=1 Tax=Salmo salar TaxID=8030 RepID=A0A1S3LUA4_SALSA|nr:cingulin-like protein 1 isoform X1 [Salmo salar]XP_013994439.2 cingulin-like protein 1 isoform X1 [Salmo salar]XP_013994440.2 cingulin-like protein 1 isoform X1 [Salmo salar]XP_013994441.2 cingulin-like protein 1 isoform X1 [Salmo salar]
MQGKSEHEHQDNNMEATAVKETRRGSSHNNHSNPSNPSATAEQGRDSVDSNGHTRGTLSPTEVPSLRGLRKSQNSSLEEEENVWRTNKRTVLSRGSSLTRSRSVKNLIHKFSENGEPSSANDNGSPVLSIGGSLPEDSNRPIRISTARTVEVLAYQNSRSNPNTATPSSTTVQTQSPVRLSTAKSTSQSNPAIHSSSSTVESKKPVPSIKLTPPSMESQPGLKGAKTGSPQPSSPSDSHSQKGQGQSQAGSMAGSGMGSESDFNPNKRPESPPSEDEPSNPVKVHQNPKYQLYLSGDVTANGSRDTNGTFGGENGNGMDPKNSSRWDSASSRFGTNYHGSLESLASRDWDTMSDRVGGFESPPRVFNSPYATAASTDYNSGMYRMSEYKEVMSPATSELNLFNSYNSRSTSPVLSFTRTVTAPRAPFSTYDTIRRRDHQVMSSQLPMRPPVSSVAMPNRRDFIEELTRQLDACQKRNQFLEAESIEMDKERNQIRLEMRSLLVNNEDLLRTNSTLQMEMSRMRMRMVELERDNTAMTERFKVMEMELTEARGLMVEANTQEYAFNFLQQSLKNKIQDAEEALEKQTLHAEGLSDKLWLAERQLEELAGDKETRGKRTSELSDTIFRLETELGEAQQRATQAIAELSLHQKLRDGDQLRVKELEETILEKGLELQRAQQSVRSLQGQVSGKLIDKERSLEEEIQLREKVQLQLKQAERSVEDLTMALQTAAQTKEDLDKQLKQAQEKAIDLESDLEEIQDSEQSWARKHKRAIEQTEQLQLKLIQEKYMNEQLDSDKINLMRQLRDLRVEMEELQNSRVQVDVITKTEIRARELENALRVEERNKVVMSNTISKLERKNNELSDQLEEEHKIATEQKDLMTQRMRSLKRQLNEAEEESSRRDAQYRHTQRELAEEREASTRLQRQLLDQHLQLKRKESTVQMRQTLENLRLDLSVDEEDQAEPVPTSSKA